LHFYRSGLVAIKLKTDRLGATNVLQVSKQKSDKTSSLGVKCIIQSLKSDSFLILSLRIFLYRIRLVEQSLQKDEKDIAKNQI
jgi:hypothetical protein